MSNIPILKPERRLECPNCELKLVVKGSDGLQPVQHPCKGLKGLMAPMVPAGTRCKVEAVEREDYVGDEVVTYDGENRPIMRVETTRDDGNDVAVFAPLARSDGGVN
jgi:hypothetical protein